MANLLIFRGLRAGRFPERLPLVSILVPARNEVINIEACITSLLNQDYPNWELLVLDDRSEDETADIARGLFLGARPGTRAVLFEGRPLPEGWAGKNWACHQLAEQARGEYLWFVDADTTHDPGTVTAALNFAQHHRADLVSAWPRLITKSIGEKLILPIIWLVGMVFIAHWLVWLLQSFPAVARILGSRFTRALGAANGQFMFFKRSSYDRIGGHGSVKGDVVEDVALGREVTARIGEGMRLYVCDALHFSKVRMYRSFKETWSGFTKNLRAMFRGQWLVFWLFLLGLWACFLAPFVKLAWVPRDHMGFVLTQITVILAIRCLVTLRLRSSWLSVLLHPIGVLLVMAIALRSWWKSRGAGVEWKGRTYNVLES